MPVLTCGLGADGFLPPAESSGEIGARFGVLIGQLGSERSERAAADAAALPLGFHMDVAPRVEDAMSTPTATSTQTDKDARPSGASIRQRVVGGATGPRTTPGDPFLAPFFETATEHVWGGVWNRPGLELKYRSLVVVSVLAATGHANEELKTHLRGALNLGWTVDELREALLQIGGYAGFPAAHEALDVLSEIVTQG